MRKALKQATELALGVAPAAGARERAELLAQPPELRHARLDRLEVPVDHHVRAVGPLGTPVLNALEQRADLVETDVERAAVPDELEPADMDLAVVAVVVRKTPGRGQKSIRS